MRTCNNFALVVMALATVFANAACANQPMPTMTAPSAVINVVGTLTVAPSSILVGNSVAVSWTSDSAVRVDACNMQCTTIATSGTSVNHTPAIRGQWKYQLYNVVATPDMTVWVAESTVQVQ